MDMLSQIPDTNGANSFGVYMPRRTVVQEYSPGDFGTPANTAGFVRTHFNNHVANVANGPIKSAYGNLGTMFHEATHTVQPSFGYGKMRGLQYDDYDPRQGFPDSTEILASLREGEAISPKGRLWNDRSNGKEVIERMKKLNPGMSDDGVKRYMDVKMFPEHQVMHEWKPQETSRVAPSWYNRQLNTLKNLF